jgi:hypothetical protein
MDERSALLPHAPSSVDLPAIGVGVGIMVGGMVLAVIGATIVSAYAPSPRSAPNNAERPRIAGPVQRTAPPQELDAYLHEKELRLHGRGVDAKTGEPFMPIEDAMRAMADTAGRPGGAR